MQLFFKINNMVQFTELRCGNIILQHFEDGEGTTLDVTSRTIFDCQVNPTGKFTYTGVPITDKLLLGCGFRDTGSYLWTNYAGNNQLFVIGQYNGDFNDMRLWINNGTYGKPIQYFHQLQNIFYAITGEELKHNLMVF